METNFGTMKMVRALDNLQKKIKTKVQITGATLKIIAIVTMLIDHIGAALIEQGVWFKIDPNAKVDRVYAYDEIFRIIGRISFPLFCFLVVEGILHTRDVRKYAIRLGIFAIISEIPFNLAFSNKVVDLSGFNVFFTLFISVSVVAGYIAIKESTQKFYEEPQVKWFLCTTIFLVGLLVAGVTNTDYDVAGVCAIMVMYEFSSRNAKNLGFVVAILLLALLDNPIELWALLGFGLILIYNGKRGRQIKYFFYIFYPMHLMLLWAIRCYIMYYM